MRISPAEAQASVVALLEAGNVQGALQTLTLASASARDLGDHEDFIEVLELVPMVLRSSDAAWMNLTGRMLCNGRKPKAIREFAAMVFGHFEESEIEVFASRHAWAVLQDGNYELALERVKPLLESTDVDARGMAWRVHSEALSYLGRDGWREAFNVARRSLSGRSLGTALIDHGFHLERAGDALAARRAWSEALALLKNDTHYTAWIHHGLGLSYAREASPIAELHFLEMQVLSRRARAKAFRARALCGLGLARRVLGEWSRAESHYREAARMALEPFDQQQAHRGLGHTLRLAGRTSEALEPLQIAARCIPAEAASGESWVFADLAAALLVLGDDDGARQAILQTGDLFGEDLERGLIVQAELARRSGDANAAIDALRGVRMGSLWAREERECFPALFQLATAMGLAEPPALTRPAKTMVEVRAAGILRVLVNGRDVRLKPTARTGELLVMLLEAGGEETLERLSDLLYGNSEGKGTNRRRHGKAVWHLANELRTALGWEASLEARGGAYRLDPDATWRYDVAEARIRGDRVPQFLEGVYSAWALETANGFMQRDRTDLN
jgi:tetratricopeptide (TPR) repeat protein